MSIEIQLWSSPNTREKWKWMKVQYEQIYYKLTVELLTSMRNDFEVEYNKISNEKNDEFYKIIGYGDCRFAEIVINKYFPDLNGFDKLMIRHFISMKKIRYREEGSKRWTYSIHEEMRDSVN